MFQEATRRSFIDLKETKRIKRNALPILFALRLAPFAVVPAADGERPNLILILADDPGCCGNTFNETPSLDRLAKQGMRFTQCYAGPVCPPTRANLQRAGPGALRHYAAHSRIPAAVCEAERSRGSAAVAAGGRGVRGAAAGGELRAGLLWQMASRRRGLWPGGPGLADGAAILGPPAAAARHRQCGDAAHGGVSQREGRRLHRGEQGQAVPAASLAFRRPHPAPDHARIAREVARGSRRAQARAQSQLHPRPRHRTRQGQRRQR